MSNNSTSGVAWPPAAGMARFARARVERRDLAARERLVQRVLSEFREMPCLRLTAAQAQRLFGLRADVGQRLIDSLVQQGLLRLDEDGRYAVPLS